MYSLIDKVAIVTGGANGIGAHIVQELIKERTKYVAIIDIDEASGIALENKIKTEHGKDAAGFFKCDITKDEELHGVFDEMVKNFGGIDVVVNNAAVASETMSAYKREIEINFTATVSSTLKALELMRVDRGGKGGTIINVSSIAALTLLSPSVFIYAATKSAILHLSICMGKEDYYRHTKVRVLTMCFGATDTEIVHKMESFDELINENMQKMIDMVKNEMFLQPANIPAQGVIQGYKTSESGSTWLIDGGEITNITNKIHDAFDILSGGIEKYNKIA
ncbi:15-hydroxyprostaglandin dehydrogenase [NAD(+)]-like [Pararge aegeria]|uniref:Jg18567 protein n=1 Tax=Pararge aegeria aegeria TaxID=348720 RepID=A0A8S4RYJ7_9NEOP|nr:15-hydroxyprostaglandin dehydrogenase [NAD(+)]-like [Pararge aegeria]CAH2243899.1 jg18567 [Pararge aegeria aegeria]